MKPMTRKECFEQQYAGAYECGEVNYLIVAVQLPSGAKEIIINTTDIPGKVQYYLNVYDDDLKMVRVPEIRILNYMFA